MLGFILKIAILDIQLFVQSFQFCPQLLGVVFDIARQRMVCERNQYSSQLVLVCS